MFSMYRFVFPVSIEFYAEWFIVMLIEFYAELFIVMFKESCLVLSIGDGNFINFIAPC